MRRGFTLLEVVVTLVLLGIMAAMVVPFFRSGVMTSATPINRLEAAMNTQQVMSAIVQDYLASTRKDTDLQTLAQRVNYSFATYRGGCSTCSGTAQLNTTVGSLTNTLRVTVTNSATGETLVHLFTVQQ